MSIVSGVNLKMLQLDQRLDVPGLWKHIEGLHHTEAIALGYQELQIPCERGRVAGKVPDVPHASLRDRAQDGPIATFARRIEKNDVRLFQNARHLGDAGQLLDSPGFKASVALQRVETRVRLGFGDRVPVLFDARNVPAVPRKVEREGSRAAVEVDDVAGPFQPRFDKVENSLEYLDVDLEERGRRKTILDAAGRLFDLTLAVEQLIVPAEDGVLAGKAVGVADARDRGQLSPKRRRDAARVPDCVGRRHREHDLARRARHPRNEVTRAAKHRSDG